jgi:hypothetical protein
MTPALHPTCTDKDRPVSLTPNGAWHAFTIKDSDGKVKKSLTPAPGVYIMHVALLGKVLSKTDSNLEVRAERYPFDLADNGTGWTAIDVHRTSSTTWFGTFTAKVVINKPGSKTSTSAGIHYRYKGGKLECSQRIIKFLRQRDD